MVGSSCFHRFLLLFLFQHVHYSFSIVVCNFHKCVVCRSIPVFEHLSIKHLWLRTFVPGQHPVSQTKPKLEQMFSHGKYLDACIGARRPTGRSAGGACSASTCSRVISPRQIGQSFTPEW